MSEELSYSIHLGSDKNRTAKAKEIAKNNSSGTTSFSNNAIQNATGLSKVNKHNLRDYDDNKELIEIIYGTNNLYKDVQNLYLKEFEESRIEYNNKQTRDDRKINNYFKHISDSKLWDLACEFIIELGDMDFWNGKCLEEKMQMTKVFKEQIEDLVEIVPQFKIANAVVHYDETSPHLHLIGVPVSSDNKRGMKKQVAKSKIFTKESLTEIQEKMRECCIKSYNKVYRDTSKLKPKTKGRNQDIDVKDMSNYKEIKKQLEKRKQQILQANSKSEDLDKTSKLIHELLDDLKPTKLHKETKLISNENIEKIKDYTAQAQDTTKSIRSINDINVTLNNVENNFERLKEQNSSLRSRLSDKDDVIQEKEKEISKLKSEISDFKEKLSFKDKVIQKLQAEKEDLEFQLSKYKIFWRNVIKYFQDKLGIYRDEKFKNVSKELYKDKIFNDYDNALINNPSKEVVTQEYVEKRKYAHNIPKRNKYEMY